MEGGKENKDQRPSSRSYNRLYFIILMHAGVIPGDIDGSSWMLLHQGFKQLRNLLAALPALEQDHTFSRVIVHGSNPVVFVGLPWRRDHHLLPFRTPHASQARDPAQIKLVCIIKHVSPF